MDLSPRLIKNAYLGLRSNLQVITDEDVNNGSIFMHKVTIGNNTSQSINKYDVLILGHQEYVTQEYDILKHFVENDGTLILLDWNVFYVQGLPCVCLVTFANDLFEYKHHEEQYDIILTNYDATLVTKQHLSYKPVIPTYELRYKKDELLF